MFVDLRKVSREIRFYLICCFESRVEKTLGVEEILLLNLENARSYQSDVMAWYYNDRITRYNSVCFENRTFLMLIKEAKATFKPLKRVNDIQ